MKMSGRFGKGAWRYEQIEGARILERQNVLQTSQVLFRRICVSLAMVLPFKDSEGGTCSYSILIGDTSAGTRQ
jgi:hypothetical protein